MKDRSDASSKNREKEEHLEEPSDWDNLHTAYWCNWPSNAPLKDADQNWDTSFVYNVSPTPVNYPQTGPTYFKHLPLTWNIAYTAVEHK